MKTFFWSYVVTAICLAIAFWWGGQSGFQGQVGLAGALSALLIAGILAVMEVSLSFDNAVVNAAVLQHMDEKWRRRFLTWGILIAVFGMRLIFPLVVVAVVAHLGVFEVARLAIQSPEQYSHHLEQAHVSISAFGGMFLLLVFLNFLIDKEKDIHWIGVVEHLLAKVGKVDAVQVVIAGAALLVLQSYLPPAIRLEAVVAGLGGILLYLIVDGLSALTSAADEDDEGEAGPDVGKVVRRTGVMGFLYLEALDASFSFDGVIGAFAITKDVVIIATGLAIGAMFVRSLTIFLVEKGTLKQFVFLEHGAHYGIGTLAVLMLASTAIHVSEVVTGLMGVAFIVAAVISSIVHQRMNLHKDTPIDDLV